VPLGIYVRRRIYIKKEKELTVLSKYPQKILMNCRKKLIKKHLAICEVSSSQGSKCEDDYLLGCAVWSGRSLLTFQGFLLLSLSQS
jgi:hypothetical protein